MTPRLKVLLAAGALAFLVGHLRALPTLLEDVDSVNFALGVEAFDVARHQPHPPGYPVFIALGRASTAAVRAVRPGWTRDRIAATGLALLGVLAGTLALFAMATLWRAVGFTDAQAVMAALLAASSPLFWITADRPLSDTTGLAAAVGVLAWLVVAWRRWSRDVAAAPTAAGRPVADAPPRGWSLAAVAAGLAIGIRSQVFWLTAPVMTAMAIDLVRHRRFREAVSFAGAAVAGALAWFVPLIALSGGPDAYLTALGSQGSDDFRGVDMLATHPSRRLLVAALARTFTEPWLARWLGVVVVVAAIAGLLRLLRARPRDAGVLVLAFAPYLGFHLLFHETATVRYALPLVVPVAGAAVLGLSLIGARAAAVVATALAVAGVALAQPPLERIAREGVPVARVFRDMDAARVGLADPPDIAMHHQVWWGVRRFFDWYRPVRDLGPQPFPGDREWLRLVEAWRGGATRPVWFLADRHRHDLEAFDPRTTVRTGRYVMDDVPRRLAGGDRLDSLDWWTIGRPAWMLGRGWAVTPELAGMTAADGAEPHRSPAEAWLRRDAGLARILIGGRYLRDAAAPRAHLTVSLDGEVLDAWDVGAAAPWFVRWIDLPGVPAGDEAYAALRVAVTSADAGRAVPDDGLVALEQFDAAPAGALMYAFASDWYEREANPSTGLQWRWSGATSTIEIRDWGRDLALTLSGESPLRYFDGPATVVVRAGDREVGRFQAAADFTETVQIPADALAAAGGRVTVGTDRTFVPADRGESPDRRRLGLRLFRVTLARR
ncbi:MAG: hypothetical protein R2752_15825 [Vicinamibacterales bacterium]